MRKFSLIVAALALTAGLGMLMGPVDVALAEDSEDSPVGLWLSASRSDGGIGTDLEFAADGQLKVNVGVAVATRYEIEETRGDHVFVVRIFDPSSGESQTSEISIKKNKLIQKVLESGERVTMKRVSKAEKGAPPSLVGSWTYSHQAGAAALTDFTEDGYMLLRIPMRSEQGDYVVGDGGLEFEWDSAQPFFTAMTLDGDRLTAELANGERVDFDRLKVPAKR